GEFVFASKTKKPPTTHSWAGSETDPVGFVQMGQNGKSQKRTTAKLSFMKKKRNPMCDFKIFDECVESCKNSNSDLSNVSDGTQASCIKEVCVG
ncbi:unnamed protein product, partial [Amoebophrya sp. A120]